MKKYIIQIILFALAVLISVIIYNYYFKILICLQQKNQIPTLDKIKKETLLKIFRTRLMIMRVEIIQ